MGKSSLKHKKVKLIFTLFLTIIALTLFGFADIMGNFSVAQASYNSYKNTSYSLLPFAKGELVEGDNYLYETSPTQDQLASFEHLTNQNAFIGHDIRIDFTDMLKNAIPDYNNYYIKNLRGVIEVPDKSLIKDEFIGDFPTNENEIVINNYMLEHFTDFGFKYYNEQTLTYNEVDTVTSFNDVKDKTIRARVKNKITELKIVGMVNYDLSMYEDKKTKWAEITESSSYNEKLELYMHADQYNFLGRLITSEGFTDKHIIEEYSEQEFSVISQSQGGGYNVSKDVNIELTNLTAPSDLGEVERYNYLNKDRIEIKKFNTINTNNYYFGNGVQTSGLAENDIIVPTSWFNTYNQAELDNYLNTTLSFKLVRDDYVAEEYNMVDYQKQLNIVGFCTSSAYYLNNDVVVADGVFDYIVDETVNTADYMYTYLNNDNTDAKLFEIMEQNNFIHKTDLSNEISNVAEMFEIMQKIFFYIAIVMAVFVAFMIMNFISASITYKKKEIGILRALGARKLDVFKVFYFEGLIIGLISYFITISLMFVGVILFNSFIQSAMNTNVVLISLSFRQIILVATICFGAIFASSYLPVNKIANKKPIDAIRNH
jgi:ABC-type antimicrobial peptide transport system permease subunit